MEGPPPPPPDLLALLLLIHLQYYERHMLRRRCRAKKQRELGGGGGRILRSQVKILMMKLASKSKQAVSGTPDFAEGQSTTKSLIHKRSLARKISKLLKLHESLESCSCSHFHEESLESCSCTHFHEDPEF